MAEVGALSTYGPPFSGENAVPVFTEFPGSRMLFISSGPRRYNRYGMALHLGEFLETFADWSSVVGVDEGCRNLPGSKERGEVTKRQTVAIALADYIGTVYFKGLKAVTPSLELERAPVRPSKEFMGEISDIFPAPQAHFTGGFSSSFALACQPHRRQTQSWVITVIVGNEGANVEERNQASSTFGMVDWGYFYDPQVVDSSAQLVVDGEQQPAEIDDDESTLSWPSSTRGSGIRSSASPPYERGFTARKTACPVGNAQVLSCVLQAGDHSPAGSS